MRVRLQSNHSGECGNGLGTVAVHLRARMKWLGDSRMRRPLKTLHQFHRERIEHDESQHVFARENWKRLSPALRFLYLRETQFGAVRPPKELMQKIKSALKKSK
jgi:hypothetical protein